MPGCDRGMLCVRHAGPGDENNARTPKIPLASGVGLGYVPPPPMTADTLCRFIFFGTLRRGAGAVERGGLENRCTREGTVGSNPTLSAIPSLSYWEG